MPRIQVYRVPKMARKQPEQKMNLGDLLRRFYDIERKMNNYELTMVEGHMLLDAALLDYIGENIVTNYFHKIPKWYD